MNAKVIAGLLGVLIAVTGPAAQAEPIVLSELSTTLSGLSKDVSDLDLLHENVGTDEGREAHELFLDYIDEEHDVYAWHLAYWAGGCMALRPGEYDQGFHPCCSGDMADLTDGIEGGLTDAVLRDYAKAALVARYDLGSPQDIGTVRVFSANEDPAAPGNARVYHHYDLWASQDGGVTYFLVAEEVKSVPFLTINFLDDRASVTELREFNSDTLVEAATQLRFVFYCVGNAPLGAPGRFQDEWNGSFNEGEDWITTCADFDEELDVDGVRRAFEAPIIKEVDVFAPGDPAAPTPWGDIDYDGDRDLADFAAFQFCFEGDATQNGCYRFDFNEDSSVDLADYPDFEAILDGPGM